MSDVRFTATMWTKKVLKVALLLPASIGTPRVPGLSVLIYHRVGAGMSAEMDLPTRVFARQMSYVKEHFEVVALAEALAEMAAGKAPLRDRVAVSFDDGYSDILTNAFPVLKEMGIRATVFVATGFVDGEFGAPLSRRIAAQYPHEPLTWDQLGEMASSGLVTIGSHSHTHRDFNKISAEEAEEDLARAEELLQSRAGVRADVFAYPRGVVGHTEIVAAHHPFALGSDGVKNLTSSFRPLEVSRIPSRQSDGLFFFERRLAGMRPYEDGVYRVLKGLRAGRA